MTKKLEKHHIPYHYDALFYKVFGDYNDLDLIKYLLENILDFNVKKIEVLNGKVLGLITDKGIYGIYEEKDGWGRLENGYWTMLQYTSKIENS